MIYISEEEYKKLSYNEKGFYKPLPYNLQFIMELLDKKLESKLIRKAKLN